jgi:hypothetical protein
MTLYRFDFDGNLIALTPKEEAAWYVEQESIAANVGTFEPTIHVAWFRAALAEIEKLDIVDAAVTAAGPVQEQLWNYATTIRRNHPSIVSIAAALNIDLDALFIRAAQIRDEQS